MNLLKLVQSKFGNIVISIMLGLGLASLFRRSCANKKCLVFVPPDMKNLNDDIYKYNGKCYKYKSEAVRCDKTKTLVKK
jgi:hypothetical protein